jgi:hypothetical protein
MAGLVTFKGSGAKVPYKKFMQARPVRNEKVEWDRTSTDSLKLYLPYKKTQAMVLMSRFIDIPDERSFKFNPMGSMVWELCDGKNTVQDIKETIVQRTRGNEKDMEKRLFKFMNRLMKNELIILDMS